MNKIQLENNEWFDLDTCVEEFYPSTPIGEKNNKLWEVIVETKNGSIVTGRRGISSSSFKYKKATQEEINLYKNRYTFPPEQEQ